ncbi:MAG: hypothetical protein Q9214_000414 [Letrouitia sp. 1 TL-2023]
MPAQGARGFADLRAKFEGKNDSSPPSRGRSPAAPDNVNNAGERPLSKVRTSFISVERSGLMGPSIGQRKLSTSHDEVTAMDGASENKPETDPATHMPKANGEAKAPIAALAEKGSLENSNEGTPAGPNAMNVGDANLADAANVGKSGATAEESELNTQPSGSKHEKAVLSGAAAPKEEDIGTLLKGSAFEPEEHKDPVVQTSEEPPPTSNNSSPSRKTKSLKSQSTSGDQDFSSSPGKVPPKAVGAPLSHPSKTSSENVGLSSTKSSLKQTTKGAVGTPKSHDDPDDSKPSTKESPSKPASLKLSQESKDDNQPSSKDNKPFLSRIAVQPSIASKPPSTLSSQKKPLAPKASASPKSSGPVSPSSTKSRAKSPTRPIRLPAGATAPTAASAAKLGIGSQPRSANRTGLSEISKPSIFGKESAPKGSSKTAPKAGPAVRERWPRSSLPAASNVSSKPKPRASLAGPRPAGDDFLARMMRPTQSSASKTHEKIEQKTPPKRKVSERSKTTSDESTKQKDEKFSVGSPGLAAPGAETPSAANADEAGLDKNQEVHKEASTEPTLTNPAAAPERAVEEALETDIEAAEQPPKIPEEEITIK